jgi:hypothetical protein
VVLIGVAIIVWNRYCTTNHPVTVSKLPTDTPIVSERKDEHSEAEGKNNKFALIPGQTPTNTQPDITATSQD